MNMHEYHNEVIGFVLWCRLWKYIFNIHFNGTEGLSCIRMKDKGLDEMKTLRILI